MLKSFTVNIGRSEVSILSHHCVYYIARDEADPEKDDGWSR